MKGIPHEGRPLSVAGINVLVDETRARMAENHGAGSSVPEVIAAWMRSSSGISRARV